MTETTLHVTQSHNTDCADTSEAVADALPSAVCWINNHSGKEEALPQFSEEQGVLRGYFSCPDTDTYNYDKETWGEIVGFADMWMRTASSCCQSAGKQGVV